MQEDMNLSLVKMISTNGIEEQCSNISNWLNQQYHLDGIGFFLKEGESAQTHFFTERVTERVSKDVVQNLEDMLLKLNQTDETQQEVLFFAQKQEKFVTFSPGEHSGSLKPMGLTIPLGVLGHSVGTLALIADPATIQNFSTQTPAKLSFMPIISGLLDNAMFHELKDNKIRMLNLYQTVSSSLSYIGDLQELLTTIISIVTSELLCEECSVLLYDEHAGRALRDRTTQVVNDVQSDPDFYGNIDKEHAFKTKSILAAPLMSGDELVGVINALNKVENKLFDKEDDQILSAIADEVAMAVKNARLFDFVVESYCKIKQGANSCKGCKRPLKSWTPCVR
ncbi:MAG: GAF domain-containing protein, partial [Deltaproteobacteria bacterium]|nr:GAF domain-containing protein [Deltaproteobacteria bacterium]